MTSGIDDVDAEVVGLHRVPTQRGHGVDGEEAVVAVKKKKSRVSLSM